jgi:hypothetical protein
MTRYFLKMIGSSEKRCPEDYQQPYADFSKRPRKVKAGHFMILYAVGGAKRIFSHVQVTSSSYPRDHERWPYRVGFEYLIRLPVSSGVDIEMVDTSGRLRGAIPRQTYFELSEGEYNLAVAALQEASHQPGRMNETNTAEFSERGSQSPARRFRRAYRGLRNTAV